MKRVWLLFALLAALLAGYIYSQKGRINSDVFSFLNIKEDAIFRQLQASAAQQVNILAPSKSVIDRLLNLNEKTGVFSQISYRVENLERFRAELVRGRLAFFKGEVSEEFFRRAVEYIYSPLSAGVLPLRDDPLSLSREFAVLKQDSNISVDSASGNFITRDKKYIYARATLAQDYEDSALLQIYHELKSSGAIVSGSAIFGTFGKAQGQREGVIMSVLGVSLAAIFLLLAFKSVRVFHLFLAPAFGFLAGLAACFAVFDSVHILVIVISTSLVGLMLDFGASWLGLNLGVRLERNSVASLRRLFLVALGASAGGYALFLFSPMQFLHQIAVFSVFGLLGAFVVSYFLLPSLLVGVKFSQSVLYEQILAKFEWLGRGLNLALKKWAFWTALAIFGVFCAVEISRTDFADNVKNYATSMPQLTDDARKFAAISGVSGEFKLVKASVKVQEQLLAELRAAGLLGRHSSLFSIVNSPQRQEWLRNEFVKFAKDEHVRELLANVGADIALSELVKTPILELDELRKFEILRAFGLLFDEPELILVGDVSANDKFYEILGRYDAQFFDLVSMINENFTQIKQSAVWLKIYGFALAFLLLMLFLGRRVAAITTGVTALCALYTLGIFAAFSDVNIFVIFGVILSSAVGIDYILFALKSAQTRAKIFGVSVAAITSIISFATLTLSQTHAVFSFGASVSVGVALNMLCAFGLARREEI